MTPEEYKALPLADQIAKHREAAKYSKQWGDIELMMRKELFNAHFPQPSPGKNRVKLDLKNTEGDQLALEGDYKINLTIDRAGWEAAVKEGLIPGAVADAIVSYSPKVKDAAYRKLDTETMKLVSAFITEKIGTPSIELRTADSIRW